MAELKFKDDKEALEHLENVQNAIDQYSASHPDEFSEKESQEFRTLLNERAKALSEATGMEVHSIFED